MSEEFNEFPIVSEQLIESLDSHFPDKMPMSGDLESICYLQGQVSVVRLLKDVRKEQTDNILSTTLE